MARGQLRGMGILVDINAHKQCFGTFAYVHTIKKLVDKKRAPAEIPVCESHIPLRERQIRYWFMADAQR